MKARLGCRSVKSVHWAIKKAHVQTEVMYDKCRVVMTISKSSFLPEEKKRGISKGYCRDDRPNRIYWARGPVRGQVNVL